MCCTFKGQAVWCSSKRKLVDKFFIDASYVHLLINVRLQQNFPFLNNSSSPFPHNTGCQVQMVPSYNWAVWTVKKNTQIFLKLVLHDKRKQKKSVMVFPLAQMVEKKVLRVDRCLVFTRLLYRNRKQSGSRLETINIILQQNSTLKYVSDDVLGEN